VRPEPGPVSLPTGPGFFNRGGAACLTRAPPDPIPISVSRPDGRSAPRPKGGRGGKSGLHGPTVPDNVRRGGPFGGCFRDSATENRPPRPRCVLAAARVKRCGKSAPRRRQRRRHGKPHREQDRIGTARRLRGPDRSGSAVRVGCQTRRATGVPEEWPSRPAACAAGPYRTRLTGRLICSRGLGGTLRRAPANFAAPPAAAVADK